MSPGSISGAFQPVPVVWSQSIDRLEAGGRSVSAEGAEKSVQNFGGFRGKRQKGFLFHDTEKSQPIGEADLVFYFTG